MNTHITWSQTRRLHLSRRMIGLAATGAALVLTAAAALTIGRPAGPAANNRTDDAAVSRSAAVEQPHDSTIVFQPGTGAAARAGAAPLVYIVDPDEHGAFVQRFLVELNDLRVQAGQSPITASVMVVDSADDEARMRDQLAATRDWQQSLSLPMTRVYDLRAQ